MRECERQNWVRGFTLTYVLQGIHSVGHADSNEDGDEFGGPVDNVTSLHEHDYDV